MSYPSLSPLFSCLSLYKQLSNKAKMSRKIIFKKVGNAQSYFHSVLSTCRSFPLPTEHCISTCNTQGQRRLLQPARERETFLYKLLNTFLHEQIFCCGVLRSGQVPKLHSKTFFVFHNSSLILHLLILVSHLFGDSNLVQVLCETQGGQKSAVLSPGPTGVLQLEDDGKECGVRQRGLSLAS